MTIGLAMNLHCFVKSAPDPHEYLHRPLFLQISTSRIALDVAPLIQHVAVSNLIKIKLHLPSGDAVVLTMRLLKYKQMCRVYFVPLLP